MSISNTNILIKRSLTTGIPSSLKQGEFAYSYASNTLFLGTPGGNGVVNVGGQYYTSTLDAATNANTASTLVKRDTNGAFYGRLYGVANTAVALDTAENFSISGGDITASAVSFNGTAPVVLNAALNAVPGLSAGFYGGSTVSSSTIPVLQVAANGRIMAIANTTVTSSFSVSDGTSSNTVFSGSTLTLKANTNSGITTNVNNNETIYFGVDNTVARTNLSSIGPQTFNTDIILPTNNMTVGGTITAQNLAISGNITYANAVSTLNISDPMIYLASNNAGNLVDIGMVAHFVGQGASAYSHYQHTGFVRDYTDNKWKLFSNVSIEPSTTVTFDANTIYDTIKVGGIDTSNGAITAGTLTLAGGLSVGGSTTLTGRANTTNDLGVGGNAYLAGGLSVSGAVTLSNALTVPNGGTGQVSFTNGSILVGSGTGALGTLANTTYSNTGTYGTNSTLIGLTVDAYGRTTSAAWAPIAGLTVPQGGTGVTSFTQNGITYGNGTGAMQVTAAAGSSDQTWSNQILTVTNAGVPVWSSAMDGGSF